MSSCDRIRRSAKILFALSGVFVAIFLVSGLPMSARMALSLSSGKRDLPEIRAFDRAFPEARCEISHLSGWFGRPEWRSSVLLHGRYVLSVDQDIAVNRWTGSVRAISPTRAFLTEVRTISTLADGRSSIEHGEGLELSTQQLDRLLQAPSQPAAWDLPLVTDKPVDGLDAVWRAGGI